MTLSDAVGKYLIVAEEFGQPMPLESFDISAKEMDEMISAWEEDYHLSRHFELLQASDHNLNHKSFRIGGIEYTGIIIYASIKEALGTR
ncbi:MAG: hypothetical protein EXQ56_09180 [Acidobacteria bacterium]|nr:hypothetical protein [Acidobacteriota bacterium]